MDRVDVVVSSMEDEAQKNQDGKPFLTLGLQHYHGFAVLSTEENKLKTRPRHRLPSPKALRACWRIYSFATRVRKTIKKELDMLKGLWLGRRGGAMVGMGE